MEYNPKSLADLGERGILRDWPNLIASAYKKTSEEDPKYNCVTWVNKITTERKDFSEDDEGDPVTDPYYLTSAPYIDYFKQHGFQICENGILEDGFEKIAIYEKDGQFKHVARQLSDGFWTSKIGEWEDIKHYTLQAVEGHPYKSKSYGRVAFFMKRESKFHNEDS